KCKQALHVLDRFHIVAKMNEALDDVRAEETRDLKKAGKETLQHSRWCFLKKPENLTEKQGSKMLRSHKPLILNWFKAKGKLSSGIVEGLNNKAKVTMRKSYGFRSPKVLEMALLHALGKLPEPKLAHDFY